MTKRDFLWLVIGWWGATILVAGSIWWQDHKTGVKSVEVPVSLAHSMEQMEQVKQIAETHEQIKAATQINEAAYIKQWASFEKRLKQLEIAHAAQTALLNQYRGQQEQIVVASQPLPAHQLVKLAREVGFRNNVEVK